MATLKDEYTKALKARTDSLNSEAKFATDLARILNDFAEYTFDNNNQIVKIDLRLNNKKTSKVKGEHLRTMFDAFVDYI